MKRNKLYDCQIPGCDRKVQIRSKIKSGEHKGKYACGICKQSADGRKIKQRTEKTVLKRKEERKGLPEFFETAIGELRERPVCENCGAKIKFWIHPVNNIAHILSKRRYKSVMTEPLNYIFLCSAKDEANDCHEKFDNRINSRPDMPVFSLAKEKFEKFSHKCLEKGKERSIFEEN